MFDQEFEPKMLTCVECGQEFEFTVGEQEFYAEKGFTNLPKRCPTCRKARKNGGKPEKKYYETTCAQCGGIARLPFEPKLDEDGNPLSDYFCSECFAKNKEANA